MRLPWDYWRIVSQTEEIMIDEHILHSPSSNNNSDDYYVKCLVFRPWCFYSFYSSLLTLTLTMGNAKKEMVDITQCEMCS